MWDRARSARRKSKSSASKSKTNFHFKRASATLTILSSIKAQTPEQGSVSMPARVVLNDITRSSLLIFIPTFMGNGQSVEVTIAEPKPTTLRGTVVQCQQIVNDQKIISNQQFPFRAMVNYAIESPADQERINTYYELIQETFLKVA